MARSGFAGGRRDLPPNWDKLRGEVFERDGYQCTQTLPSGRRCPRHRGDSHGTRLECDHIGSKWDHRIQMLATLCSHHHGQKTAQQGIEARERLHHKPPGRPEGHPSDGLDHGRPRRGF